MTTRNESSTLTMKINIGKDRGRIKHSANEMKHDKSSTLTMEINTSKDEGLMKPPLRWRSRPTRMVSVLKIVGVFVVCSGEDEKFLMCVMVKRMK